ncbi:MAG: hypothetical protein MUF64_00680 [Polyangiaceae bacterium]|nr:hypothetical protein [Polyangiaceae bacterium]
MGSSSAGAGSEAATALEEPEERGGWEGREEREEGGAGSSTAGSGVAARAGGGSGLEGSLELEVVGARLSGAMGPGASVAGGAGVALRALARASSMELGLSSVELGLSSTGRVSLEGGGVDGEEAAARSTGAGGAAEGREGGTVD